MDRQKHRKIDIKTDTWIDRHAFFKTSRRTNRKTEKQVEFIKTDTWTCIQLGRQIYRQIVREEIDVR